MHVGTISFCGRTGHNIKSDLEKNKILQTIERKFGIRVLKKHHDVFQGPASLETVQRSPHLASFRSNGNPYYVYLTMSESFVETCMFIDKKIQQGYFLPRIIVTRLLFDASLFQQGTLLEGEMVRRKDNTWLFLASDLLVDCGQSLTNLNLVRRLNRLYGLLAEQWRPDGMDICDIQVKKYFRVTQIQRAMSDFLPHLDYTCRGIYFKPFFLKFRDLLLNFDDSLVKKAGRIRYKDASNFLLLPDAHGPENETQNKVDQDICLLRNVQKDINDVKEVKEVKEIKEVNEFSEVNEFNHQVQHHPINRHLGKHQVKQDNFANECSGENPATPRNEIEPSAIVKRFLVKKTSLPDIYELYECPADVQRRVFLDACIPGLAQSKMMRGLFAKLGVTDALPMECSFHNVFQKWVPKCVLPS